MDGRLILLFVSMVMMVHSCYGDDTRGYGNQPARVVERPPRPEAPPITYCSFVRTRVLLDQQFQVRGYQTYRTCRAEAIINTCDSGSCTQTQECDCCKPSAKQRWKTQEVSYNCGFGDFKRVSFHSLEPAYCECTRC